MLPLVGCAKARISFEAVVLPQPDSPTRPRVVPARIRNDTPSTARTSPADHPRTPRRTGKCLVRLETSSRPPLSVGGLGIFSGSRSEEHTSELQSLRHLVCRLLLEKKKA